jgi:hypothetical protein
MKKLLLLLTLLCASLYADDYEKYPFIGVTVATESVCLNGESDNAGAIGINYGLQSRIDRSMLTLYSSGSFTSFGVEYDRILATELLAPEIRAYGGLSGGLLYNEGAEDEFGFYYGINLGVMLYTSKHIDIDLSYYYHQIEGMDDRDQRQGVRLLFHYFY